MIKREIPWLKSNQGNKKLGITVYEKEFPDIKKGWDSRWLVGSAYFEDDFFKVGIIDKPMFEKYEIKNLLNGLKKISKKYIGTVELNCIEPYVKFSIEIGKTGTGQVVGEIWNVQPESTKIAFNYETDQTCVKDFYKSLNTQFRNI